MSKPLEPKYKQINQQQLSWGAIDLEKLVPPGHPARLIWGLSGRLDLAAWEAGVRTFAGQAGSPAWPPRTLLCVWLYSYQQGVSSASEIARRMAWEPGLQWLCGFQSINVHTLCDFRTAHREALDQLLQQLLALLAEQGLVDLHTVVQDGTKMQARAGKGSGHRRERLEDKLAQAKAYMQQVDRQGQDSEGGGRRQAAAKERAARECVERLQAAWDEMERLGQQRRNQQQVRVSATEPEARRMRHSEHGGWMYSYNVQLSTEPSHNFIVGVSVTNEQNDTQQLAPALATVKHFTRHQPERIIADHGYVTRRSIKQMAAANVELIAPVKEESKRQAHTRKRLALAPEFDASRFEPDAAGLRCPANQVLTSIGVRMHHGEQRETYQASAETCAACPHRPHCCGKSKGGRRVHRVLEHPSVRAHIERMQTEQAREQYGLRSRVAEFPHMRIKANWGLRRFSVRGMAKAATEMLWMVLAYNFSQWMWVTRTQARAA